MDTATIGRQIAAESRGSPDMDPRDVLSKWDRETFFQWDSVQLRIPLRDPTEVRQHLKIMSDVIHDLLYKLEKDPRGDRTDLLTVHSVVKSLNQKLNAYRSRKR